MLYSALRLGSLPWDLRLPAFRTAALSFTTAAALFGASAWSAAPARADDAVSPFAAACAAIQNPEQKAGCLLDAITKNTSRLKAEGEAAKKETKLIKDSEVCFDFLKKGRDDKKFSREAVLEAAGGKLTPDNSCVIARKFGYGQRASVETPRVQ